MKWGIIKHHPKRVLESREHPVKPLNILENKNKERKIPNADHRVIGQQLDLFSIDSNVGPGLVLWHPKGTIVRNAIRDFWEKEHLKNGYQIVCTPHIARKELWAISGHLDYYKQNMYVAEKGGEDYAVKPMNCPFHIQIYKSRPRSYGELPIRYAEWGTVYRYERSGTLHGLLRVRGFTQDDAHIFCTKEQATTEVIRILDLTKHILQKFGFLKYRIILSTRDAQHPEKYMGSEQNWHQAQKALAGALESRDIPYREMPGEAVFYGPKIDLNIVDAFGQEWQCTTVQFDFNLPKRFNISYIGADNKKHRTVMIHRALLGAVERFFAILLEHYNGNLPAWLAPVQVAVLPISSDNLAFAEKVHSELLAKGVRSKLDATLSTTINYRIRQAELQKIPYMAICGKREAETGTVSLREHGRGNIGSIRIAEIVTKITENPQS